MIEFILNVAFSTFCGAFVGSYIITIISRIRAKEPIRGGFSHCYNCKKNLPVVEVIPIFSYLKNRGRCPYCNISIGLSTILWELGIGLVFGTLSYIFYPYIEVGTVVISAAIVVILQWVMKVK